MSGWIRHVALTAQVRTGFSPQVLIWLIVAAISVLATIFFLVIAAFVWIAQRYDGVVAGISLSCFFLAIAVVAGGVGVSLRRRTVARARVELAARSHTNWLDPKFVALGFQIGRAIGWRKVASLAAVGALAAGLAKEWTDRDRTGAGSGKASFKD